LPFWDSVIEVCDAANRQPVGVLRIVRKLLAALDVDPKLHNLKIQVRDIAALKPCARDPRTHSPKQIRQIADSIREFGFTNPILIDGDGGVIAGHGRIEGAKLLGIERVPTIRLDHMTEAQKRAYALADNKLAENAGWDHELLAFELEYIKELDIDFDLTVTGFETPEIDMLLNAPDAGDSGDGADDVPEVDNAQPSVTRPGDLWILGEHQLLCADATKAESFECLLDGKHAQMIFTDPPYNVPIAGNVSGLGKIKHREFAMASGEMSEGEFTDFLKTVFANLAAHSVDGSIHFVCMDWRHVFELLSAGRVAYAELKNLCVWNKNNGGMGSLYRSKHELVWVFKNGSAPHINNVELGAHGRNRTNVWDYPGVNSQHESRLDDLAMHPTVKPVAMIADAILDCSKRGGIVLDCFGGSGTTLIASEKTGRRGCLIELDPAYIDVTIKRFQKLTGKKAINAETRRTFTDMESARAGEKCSPDN
jgi:DNA modification methylase